MLGLPAINALTLIKRIEVVVLLELSIEAVMLSESSIKQSYPNPFKGLGKLGDNYSIKLKPDAKPLTLHTALKVPIPLCKKWKKSCSKCRQ